MSVNKFAEWAREARLEQHKPLREVARQLGVTISYVCDIEHGNRQPPREDLVRRWADVLGLDAGLFLLVANRNRGDALERECVELVKRLAHSAPDDPGPNETADTVPAGLYWAYQNQAHQLWKRYHRQALDDVDRAMQIDGEYT